MNTSRHIFETRRMLECGVFVREHKNNNNLEA
jgi:hypothetical protein